MPSIYVLVGPLSDASVLARWAHEEFRKSAEVAFIGVDSGTAALLDSGLPMSVSIGDFDGPTKIAFPRLRELGLPAIRLPKKKERSDLAFALELCIEAKAEYVYAYGFQGGRPDHDFAVHLDLSDASLRIPRVVSVGEIGATFYLAAKYAPLQLEKRSIEALHEATSKPASRRKGKLKQASTGDRGPTIVSVFPVGSEAKGVRLLGLRFSPSDGSIGLTSQGLSNEIRQARFSIGLDRGRLAIFFPNRNSNP